MGAFLVRGLQAIKHLAHFRATLVVPHNLFVFFGFVRLLWFVAAAANDVFNLGDLIINLVGR